MKNSEAIKVVKLLEDYVNTFSSDDISKEFNREMSLVHRTLQQSFTRLVLGWIEHCASDEYQTDLRNQAAKEMSVLLIKLLRKHYEEQGYSSSSLDMLSKPSASLPTI